MKNSFIFMKYMKYWCYLYSLGRDDSSKYLTCLEQFENIEHVVHVCRVLNEECTINRSLRKNISITGIKELPSKLQQKFIGI